jgi:hypothetical protein
MCSFLLNLINLGENILMIFYRKKNNTLENTKVLYTGIETCGGLDLCAKYIHYEAGKPCQVRLVGRLACRKAYLQAGRQTYYSSPPQKSL